MKTQSKQLRIAKAADKARDLFVRCIIDRVTYRQRIARLVAMQNAGL